MSSLFSLSLNATVAGRGMENRFKPGTCSSRPDPPPRSPSAYLPPSRRSVKTAKILKYKIRRNFFPLDGGGPGWE